MSSSTQQRQQQQEDLPLIGVLALQGAFEEHQHCLENSGCRTKQVRRNVMVLLLSLLLLLLSFYYETKISHNNTGVYSNIPPTILPSLGPYGGRYGRH